MKDKNDLYILLIVGLVAVIGIVIMLSSGFKDSDDGLVDETGLAANTRGKPAAPSCVDGDSGYAYDIKSTVTINRNKKVTKYTDSCSGNYLVEYVCSANSVLSAQYHCPNICTDGACANPVCAVQDCAGAIDTGTRDDTGCPIYECPVCMMPGCDGAYNTGRIDSYGCPVYECPVCPQYIPPAPGWCENGTIVPGIVDNNGCQSAPMCINDNTPRCSMRWTCLANNTYSGFQLSDCSYVNTTYCPYGCSNDACISMPSPPSLPPVPGLV